MLLNKQLCFEKKVHHHFLPLTSKVGLRSFLFHHSFLCLLFLKKNLCHSFRVQCPYLCPDTAKKYSDDLIIMVAILSGLSFLIMILFLWDFNREKTACVQSLVCCFLAGQIILFLRTWICLNLQPNLRPKFVVRLNELTYEKHFEQCLSHCKHSLNVIIFLSFLTLLDSGIHV